MRDCWVWVSWFGSELGVRFGCAMRCTERTYQLCVEFGQPGLAIVVEYQDRVDHLGLMSVGRKMDVALIAIDDAVLARETCPVRRSGEINVKLTFFLLTSSQLLIEV